MPYTRLYKVIVQQLYVCKGYNLLKQLYCSMQSDILIQQHIGAYWSCYPYSCCISSIQRLLCTNHWTKWLFLLLRLGIVNVAHVQLYPQVVVLSCIFSKSVLLPFIQLYQCAEVLEIQMYPQVVVTRLYRGLLKLNEHYYSLTQALKDEFFKV